MIALARKVAIEPDVEPPEPVAIWRAEDAARLNEIANHPDVRPLIGLADGGPLDFGAFALDRRNVIIEFALGAFVFEALGDCRYELHTMILPEGRGAPVLPAAQAAFRWLFVHTDAAEIVTKVPGSNKPADLMARRAGFALSFVRAKAWEDGGDLAFYTLPLEAWLAGDPVALAEGRAFHEALEAAKAAAGSERPSHDDDEAHDRAVGAACLMAKAGNHGKAAWFYNRWARFAGYLPARLIPQAPLVDIGDAILTFRDNRMEILQCREH